MTRRTLLAAGLGVAGGTPAKADEPVKITQAEAQYQDTPKGNLSCALCTFFVKPRACKVVAGEISPSGWCKLFDLPD